MALFLEGPGRPERTPRRRLGWVILLVWARKGRDASNGQTVLIGTRERVGFSQGSGLHEGCRIVNVTRGWVLSCIAPRVVTGWSRRGCWGNMSPQTGTARSLV
ncbi:hypothetical protein N657DRAFT_481345 [Parathielavia appendiculata]|uniref:Uncharacterized protein n=1 Tax=Parathielavia appendiculata TaxID=2587402 RepID=A0AAN6Z2E6_9PEZI|nr:hypothetical protein N657DRAFT_481345 [Parathielavia appendiculata]